MNKRSSKFGCLAIKHALRQLVNMIFLCTFFVYANVANSSEPSIDQWFEDFKSSATSEHLYRFLYELPKGGDLHNHLTGSNFVEWWGELANDTHNNGGYQYYIKTALKQCKRDGAEGLGEAQSFLLFVAIQGSTYADLSKCEQSEYTKTQSLTATQKAAWLNSLYLDKPHEGREEFFQTHWQRLNQLTANPYIIAEMLVKNMQAFGDEGLSYLETQVSVSNFLRSDGSPFSMQEVADIYRQRLSQPDAKATGVTVRLQKAVLRFLPNAEKILEKNYKFVNQNRDLYVGLNAVGREDNEKGHPLRFLSTLRKLRSTLPAVKLSFHAGEAEEPNFNVRDTLSLGAERIGHGLNLITDPSTMLRMRNSHYLIEINLISNLKLNYIDNYAQHPFPEYLRTGIPVALSTDDRGMWDSNITDEFFVAVKEFNLSWSEIQQLNENSIAYSFLSKAEKTILLDQHTDKTNKFIQKILNKHEIATKPIQTRQFICLHYSVCINDKVSSD